MAISHLEPWRAEIPIKFFASRIRFQIRIDDLRALVKDGKAKIDNILGKLISILKLDANNTLLPSSMVGNDFVYLTKHFETTKV